MLKYRKIGNISPLALLIGGALFEGAVYLISSFALALFSYNMNDPVGVAGLMSMIALVLSGSIGGALISRLREDGGIGIAALATLLLSLIFLLVGIIRGGGSVSLSSLLSYLLMIGAAALSAFFLRPRSGHKRRR